MKKHQQWLDNRNYEHHLHCLQQIRARKSRENVLTASHKSNKKKRKNHHSVLNQSHKQVIKKQRNDSVSKIDDNCSQTYENINMQHSNQWNKYCSQEIFQRPFTGVDQSNTMGISLKQKNLLWENFLIGKRIIQTPPVICKKKLDYDYEKHKQLLKARRKNINCQNFRQKRLKIYNENIAKITDNIRVHSIAKRYLIVLNIVKIVIFRSTKQHYENLQVAVKLQHSEQEKIPSSQKYYQYSEHVSAQVLEDYNFYFQIAGKQIKKLCRLWVQLREHKNLEPSIIGSFSTNFGFQKVQNQSFLYRVGKKVGSVKYRIELLKKTQYPKKQIS